MPKSVEAMYICKVRVGPRKPTAAPVVQSKVPQPVPKVLRGNVDSGTIPKRNIREL